MGPTINLLTLNVIPLLCTYNYNSAANLNILTVLSPLESLAYVLFFKVAHSLFAKLVTFLLVFIEIKDTYDGETSGRRIT